jgi:L-aspartate oxidase
LPKPGKHDFIVIGSGVAGSFAALHAARAGSVLLLTKTAMQDSNSLYAQGGIAAAMGGEDSPGSHYRDTVEAGRGLCDDEAVRILTEEGPQRIRELLALGVRFDKEGDRLALGREAAHSAPRIIHAGGDTTGAEMQRGLHQALRDASVDAREGHVVLRLIVEGGICRGLLARMNGDIVEHRAAAVILAAGGGGQLFSHTTNPPNANGEGAALAYEAGAELMDMEFFQFHPTALTREDAPRFLISEAVRGEGGLLLGQGGERFMVGVDPRAELAPRDVVARAIWAQMERDHLASVNLDLRHLDGDRVRGRFPQIYATCLRFGIDITADLIPVAPAAHYMIGGVRTDLDGATSMPGLYACGEVACVGVHGANRLASNSLLESVVFARRAARAAAEYVRDWAPVGAGQRGSGLLAEQRDSSKPRRDLDVAEPAGMETDVATREELPEVMWQNAGLVRHRDGLSQALRRLGDGSASKQHAVAALICQSALLRDESRGVHFRTDYPQTDDGWRGHIVLQIDRAPQFEAG